MSASLLSRSTAAVRSRFGSSSLVRLQSAASSSSSSSSSSSGQPAFLNGQAPRPRPTTRGTANEGGGDGEWRPIQPGPRQPRPPRLQHHGGHNRRPGGPRRDEHSEGRPNRGPRPQQQQHPQRSDSPRSPPHGARPPRQHPGPGGGGGQNRSGPGSRVPITPEREYAQKREHDRLRRVDPNKPEWKPQADRLARSAVALGLDPSFVGSEIEDHRERSRRFKGKGGGGGGSEAGGVGPAGAKEPGMLEPWQVKREQEQALLAQRQRQQAASRPKKIKAKQVLKKVELPSTLRLDNLVNLLHERLCELLPHSLSSQLMGWTSLTHSIGAVAVQRAAERIGLEDVRPDRRQFHLFDASVPTARH